MEGARISWDELTCCLLYTSYATYNFSGGFRFYDAVINDRALIEKAYACGMDY